MRRRLSAIDGLVNCAGIKGVGSIADVEQETWREVMAVNLDGTVNLCQA